MGLGFTSSLSAFAEGFSLTITNKCSVPVQYSKFGGNFGSHFSTGEIHPQEVKNFYFPVREWGGSGFIRVEHGEVYSVNILAMLSYKLASFNNTGYSPSKIIVTGKNFFGLSNYPMQISDGTSLHVDVPCPLENN